MKVRLKNVGKVSEANLKFDGITVLAGNNNSGKSTVGKAVFALFYALENLDEKIVNQKRQVCTRMIINELYKVAQNANDARAVRVSYNYARRIADVIIGDSVDIQEKAKAILAKAGAEKDIADKLIEEAQKINLLPEENLIKTVVTQVFSRVFHSQINNVSKLQENAEIEAEIRKKKIKIVFNNNGCADIHQEIKIMNEAVYLDNPFIIDRLEDSDADSVMSNRVLEKMSADVDLIDGIIQQEYNDEKIKAVVKLMNEIAPGDVYQDEAESYMYRDANGTYAVNNLSTGLKSFVILKMLLKKGQLKDNDVLILDEPEIHLHPEWQMKYAELIVLLQKSFELTVVITTHSQIFLEALELYAKKYGRKDVCNFYVAEERDYGCEFADVTNDMTKIYSHMVDPSIALNELRWELEEECDE